MQMIKPMRHVQQIPADGVPRFPTGKRHTKPRTIYSNAPSELIEIPFCRYNDRWILKFPFRQINLASSDLLEKAQTH